jgi:hypothetical protein
MLLKLKEFFVALHLVLPTPQNLLNLIKEWGRYGVFDIRRFSVW